jgi:arsenite-transporting ATPase
VVDDLSRRERAVIMVMGKGGVGKSTVASALALALAEAGHKVHLSTTDPAAHLNLVLEGAGSDLGDRFTVSRIDPEAEVAAYRSEIMDTIGSGLDEDGRALLSEDLASPCTEEIAVFRAFARTVGELEEGFVVLDTAPTGHTLLLLDNTLSYHREVQRSTGEVPESVRQLLPRLRDPELTHVMIVTLPQATPVFEASRLQDDLRRAGIEPDWWIVNQSWTGIQTTDPVLEKLAGLEAPWLKQVAERLSSKTVGLPWQAVTPQGRDGLLQLL